MGREKRIEKKMMMKMGKSKIFLKILKLEVQQKPNRQSEKSLQISSPAKDRELRR